MFLQRQPARQNLTHRDVANSVHVAAGRGA